MKRKLNKIAVSIVILICLFIYLIYWAFFDIQRIKGEEVIAKSTSANDKYTVTAYLNNGGATVDTSVLGVLTNDNTGKEKNIYWQYHCDTADIKWIDNETVCINGITINVLKDTYDYRNDDKDSQ